MGYKPHFIERRHFGLTQGFLQRHRRVHGMSNTPPSKNSDGQVPISRKTQRRLDNLEKTTSIDEHYGKFYWRLAAFQTLHSFPKAG
jgi:hypothetical protein